MMRTGSKHSGLQLVSDEVLKAEFDPLVMHEVV